METRETGSHELGVLSRYGIAFGLEYRLPASGLAAVYDGGIARLVSSEMGKPFEEYVIQAGSHTFTASKDTYVYVNGTDGVLTYTEVANNATKPTLTDIGETSQFVALVVTDGTNITSIKVLKQQAQFGRLHRIDFGASFVTANQGALYKRPGFNGRLVCIRSTVTGALGASDTGTIVTAIGRRGTFTNATGTLTVAASAAVADRDEQMYTGGTEGNDHTFGAYDELRFTSLKTTTGGTLEIEVLIEER